MAFTITSSTQTQEEMAAAIEHFGGRVSPPEPKAPDAPAATPTAASASEPAPASGELPSGDAGKPASASDAGETIPQGEPGEVTPGTSAKPDTKPQQPGKDFEPRRKQLERQVSRLHEDLEIERGSKTALQKQIDDLNAKLAASQPPTEAAPPETAGPVKPKRPTLAESDFDNDKYDQALESYDVQMLDYSRAIARKEFEEARKVELEAEQKRKQDEATAQTFDQFAERKDEQRADYPDWDQVFEEAGELEIPAAVELFVIKSDVPADLLYHFAKDASEGGKDLARISKLDQFSQVREMTKIEIRLAAEREARKPGKPAATPEKPATEPKPAAPRRPAPEVVPPIEPVGGRASAKEPALANATSAMDYIRMRKQGVNR